MSAIQRATAGYLLLVLAALCVILTVPYDTSGTDRLRAVLAGETVAGSFNPLHATGLLLAAAACAVFLSRRAE